MLRNVFCFPPPHTDMGMKRHSALAHPIGRLSAAALALCLLTAGIRGCAISREQQQAASPQLAVFSEGEVLTMPLNEYLIGVVGGEMPASFPLEALKAQAVAARTYAVRRMACYGGEGCGKGGADICTDSACCQAYTAPPELEEGFGENARRYMDKLAEAVYSTDGQVILYNGAPIEALYHSSAGGRTEDAQNVFSSALPYLVSVSSPGEEGGRYHGEKEYTPKEFAAAVNEKWPKAKLERKKLSSQVEILSRYQSGQVEKLRLNKVTVSGKELRKLLGLNSANFTIDISDSVLIRTTGYGHGVGMSQYGARAMALEGADHKDILTHYYTGVKVERME